MRFGLHTTLFRTLVLLLGASLLTGCTSYRTLSFQVVDLESREPIQNAKLVIEQGTGDPPFGPKTAQATTDENGIAKLKAADEPYVAINAEAAGYVGERFRVLTPHATPEADSPFVGTVERTNPMEFEVRLLGGPQAIVTLVVPDDFAGAIELEYGATDDFEPGDRRFTVYVEDGTAMLPASPALDVAHRFDARRVSGERLAGPLGSWEETEPLRSQTRLRGPVDGVRVPVYVIGDLARFQRVMRAMYP
jgi:hypothetical protein